MAPTDPGRIAVNRGANTNRSIWVRIASAIVLAPLAIGSAYVGGWLFALFWGLAALGIMGEWAFLVDREHGHRASAVGALALVIAMAFVGYNRILPAAGAVLLGALGCGALPSSRRVWLAAGVIYAGALLIAPAALRADAQWGFLAIVFLFAVVWATDVAAYFAGRALGGPKLWPQVSPNKTWSGAVAGMTAAVIVATLVAKIGGAEHWWPIAVLAGGLSVVGQAGDLLESGIKRRFGAKDASHLIPGHGGIMDRLDAFVTASVAAALIGIIRGSLQAPGHGLLAW